MTIAELFAEVLRRVVELLKLIVGAFVRTFNLVAEDKWGDLVLQDLGIVVVVTVVLLWAPVAGLSKLVESAKNWLEDRRDND